MPVEVKIGHSSYQIACQESEREKITQLANNLNQKVESLIPHFGTTDEKKLLVMASLLLQEEATAEKNENNGVSDEDVYDAVSETMENVTDYIKKFTNRIKNY